MRLAILSCGALAREVRHVCQAGAWPHELAFVPPLLHLYPARLRAVLAERLDELRVSVDRTLVVYGRCLPDMPEFLGQHGAEQVQGEHCLEIVGGDRFWAVVKDCPGTFFLIPSWIQAFGSTLREGLGLDKDPRLKNLMFRHYRQVVYFDTCLYGDLDDKALEIAADLELPLAIEPIGVKTLHERLAAALDGLQKREDRP